ncbi:zinc finger MYM-type protein 1-like [Lissotriton helveticus]
MNTVQELITRSFQARPLEEKLHLKQLGPHQPDLNLQTTSQDRGKMSKCTFSKAWYTKADWLTGCPLRNSLFCFPCLLFGGEFSWTNQGITDLKHLSEEIEKHAYTRKHMENLTRLGMLGEDAPIEHQINDAYHQTIQKHNEAVDRNRRILYKIIDCIRFCGAFELALQGYDESESSSEPGIFRGLVDLIASIDKELETHLASATVFNGTSKTIQNQLLDCMFEIMRSHIVQELQNTDFVAIQVGETTDVATKTQSVLVFRYLDNDGEVVERFYGFTHLRDSSAETITASILCELNLIFPELPQKQKLIAQSYDGASVMSGGLGVQKRIQDVYPNAHYVHCYTHQLNLIMQQAVSKIRETRIFFQDVRSMAAFFTRSPQRTEAFDEIVNKSVPRGSSTRWNFNIRTVNLIYEHREDLEECFADIEANDEFDYQSKTEARVFARTLQDREFQFLLFLFHDIMVAVDLLYNQLQAREMDTVKVKECTTMFVQSISKVRDGADNLDCKLPEHSTFSNGGKNNTIMVRIAKEICDIVIVHAQERFSFTKHLASATLLQSEEFAKYDKSFPERALNEAVEAYPMLIKEQLRTELTVLYAMPVYRKATSALTLLALIHKLHMEKSLTETVTLLKIVITTSMTSESEQCFSALKRIKTFLSNTMLEERLNTLAMLSVESKLVQKIPDFNIKVIDKFAALKERHTDFMYKK